MLHQVPSGTSVNVIVTVGWSPIEMDCRQRYAWFDHEIRQIRSFFRKLNKKVESRFGDSIRMNLRVESWFANSIHMNRKNETQFFSHANRDSFPRLSWIVVSNRDSFESEILMNYKKQNFKNWIAIQVNRIWIAPNDSRIGTPLTAGILFHSLPQPKTISKISAKSATRGAATLVALLVAIDVQLVPHSTLSPKQTRPIKSKKPPD